MRQGGQTEGTGLMIPSNTYKILSTEPDTPRAGSDSLDSSPRCTLCLKDPPSPRVATPKNAAKIPRDLLHWEPIPRGAGTLSLGEKSHPRICRHPGKLLLDLMHTKARRVFWYSGLISPLELRQLIRMLGWAPAPKTPGKEADDGSRT